MACRTVQSGDVTSDDVCALLLLRLPPARLKLASQEGMFGPGPLSEQLRRNTSLVEALLLKSSTYTKTTLSVAMRAFVGQVGATFSIPMDEEWVATQAYVLKQMMMRVRLTSARAKKGERLPPFMKTLVDAFRRQQQPRISTSSGSRVQGSSPSATASSSAVFDEWACLSDLYGQAVGESSEEEDQDDSEGLDDEVFRDSRNDEDEASPHKKSQPKNT